MCAINLAIGTPERVKKMVERTKHRGTVTKFLFVDNLGFGGVRLPIQSLSNKYNTPYETDKYIILYNGEIYSFKELKQDAECDIELIAEDYDIRTFDGDFAYLRYNKETELIEIVTDQYGKKQLYYKIDERGRVTGISSEIKGLVEKEDSIDMYYLSTVARFNYFCHANNTIVQNIKKFEPGKKYTINDRGEIISKEDIKWNSDLLIPKNVDKNDFKQLMELSVKRRLVSDIPISVLFSGGLDSSILLYTLKKLNVKPKIFTIKNEDDLIFAQEYAKDLQFEVQVVEIDENDSEKAYLASELVADLGSTTLNYNLFKKVKENGFSVVLTGDAADEISSGYRRNQIFDFQQNDIFNELINYHFPRLDRTAMSHTVEFRSPYSADYIIDFMLKLLYKDRIDKKFLREQYRKIIPDYIVDRIKTPLKIDNVKVNKEVNTLKLCQLWKDKLFKEFKCN